MIRMLMTRILACLSRNTSTTSITGILKKVIAPFRSNPGNLPAADCLLPYQIKRPLFVNRVSEPNIAFCTVLIYERSRRDER